MILKGLKLNELKLSNQKLYIKRWQNEIIVLPVNKETLRSWVWKDLFWSHGWKPDRQNREAEQTLINEIFNAGSTSNERLPRIGIAASGGGYRAMLCGAGQIAGLDSRAKQWWLGWVVYDVVLFIRGYLEKLA